MELGKWVRREFKICGDGWNVSSVDVAVAGLGWFAVEMQLYLFGHMMY